MAAVSKVDGSRAEGLWLSLKDLAAAGSVTKQAISQNLVRWAEQGTIVATRRDGRELVINVAEYDLAKGERTKTPSHTAKPTA